MNVCACAAVATPAAVSLAPVPPVFCKPVIEFAPRNVIFAQPFWKVLGTVIETLLIEPNTPESAPDAVLVGLPLRMLRTVVS